MTDAVLIHRIELLTNAVQALSSQLGSRLTRAQLAERMGVHRNTIAKRIADPRFPKPGRDGKWLLSDIIEWERSR